jgi:TRAP-type C4-dicarboxylate transport system permease small subunit
MNTRIRFQLSTMMFLQFFIWGAWYVTAPNYLGTIGFTGTDFGWTYSVRLPESFLRSSWE